MRKVIPCKMGPVAVVLLFDKVVFPSKRKSIVKVLFYVVLRSNVKVKSRCS